jgi:hypothetical protein
VTHIFVNDGTRLRLRDWSLVGKLIGRAKQVIQPSRIGFEAFAHVHQDLLDPGEQDGVRIAEVCEDRQLYAVEGGI